MTFLEWAGVAVALIVWRLRERPSDRSGNSGRYGHVFRRDEKTFGNDGIGDDDA